MTDRRLKHLAGAALLALCAIATAGGAAQARGGSSGGQGSSYGDSWLREEQQNPRYVEPGAYAHRYQYRPFYGYGYPYAYVPEYQPLPARPRGRIYVEPAF